MIAWGLRSIVMTAVHVVARVLLGMAVTAAPLQGTVARYTTAGIVILIAMLWAGIDSIYDTRQHPLEEDRRDLILRWIITGVITALASGIICHILDMMGFDGLGARSWFFDLTSGAAGTALMVILPATVGVGLGRWLGKRKDVDDAAERTRRQQEARETEEAVGAGQG